MGSGGDQVRDTYDEDDLLPISALQHFAYCKRQWALIHLEQIWADNTQTVEGTNLHSHAHREETETRPGCKTIRGMRLRSLKLGLAGIADVVEIHFKQAESSGSAIENDGSVIPVEYKRGRAARELADEIQLCAQAMCLEEMMGRAVPRGFIFHGQPRRRSPVDFTPELRRLTEDYVSELHEFWNSRNTPPPQFVDKCRSCSLIAQCLPSTLSTKSAAAYLLEMHREGSRLEKE